MHFSIQPQHQMRIVVVATMLAVSACGASGGDAASPAPSMTQAPRPITQTDLQIAQSLYAGVPRTPAGFYSEAALTDHSYLSTQHLKASDIDASTGAPPREYELCTNDWNEALAWSEASAQQASSYADLMETNDDARFFEFGRARQGDPAFYLRTRVFKCAYLDRSAANLLAASGPAGALNQRPLSASALQSLSEYLWQFTTYNNFGHVVLKSSGESTPTALSHTLHIGDLERGGVSGVCDRITVIAWRHEVATATGQLELDVATLWTFGARESAGVAELCSGQ